MDKADAELLRIMTLEAQKFCARRWEEEKQSGRDEAAKRFARIIAKLHEILAMLE